jgi:hypothetical protein
MKNTLSSKERLVVEFLQETKVSTKNKMGLELNISPITVIRALKKYGYYSSYNYNASYYTLHDIPQFNEYDLWSYDDIRFSKYPNINETIIAIINQSQQGYTTTEMSQLLGVETKNLLSRLRKQDRLTKFYIGHQAVYSSIDTDLHQAQKQSREQQRIYQLEQSQQRHWESGIFPEGIDVTTIIHVLICMIRKPNVSAASLSMSLQARNVKVTAEDIRKIISCYGLEKKGHDRSCAISQQVKTSINTRATRSIAITGKFDLYL